MAQIAIKGHQLRGDDVIALLEMLGGKNNPPKLEGNNENVIYYIKESNNEIICDAYDTYRYLYTVFTLEEFEKKFPYKIGNIVSIGNKPCKILNIQWNNSQDKIHYEIENYPGIHTVEHLRLFKKQKPIETTGVKINNISRINKVDKDKYEILAGKDYEIIEENGKYYVIKKKPTYPNSYEECCKVLGITDIENGYCGYEWELLGKFQELFICRNAYWKIIGKEMGLDKSWKPDLQDKKQTKYAIINVGDNIAFEKYGEYNIILAFPTEEIRDTFYRNFEGLIKACKELL